MIRHFRIINGDEVIGEIEKETSIELSIKNPLVVVEMPEIITLAKYVPFSENQTINIKKSHIIAITEIHEEMIRYYKNTLILSKDSSLLSIKGLSNVNEQMEDYLANRNNIGEFIDNPNSKSSKKEGFYFSSNTVH